MATKEIKIVEGEVARDIYGSSLKDPEGVDTCTKCKGVGLVPKDERQGDIEAGE
jgi:hypothetical protein